MTDWKTLSDAYGVANQIPLLIKKVRTDPSDAIWGELWSRLCHQGTVYSASYAALAPLCDVASSLPPSRRADALSLIGQIIASDDVHACRRPTDEIHALSPKLRELVDQSLHAAGPDQLEFIYCLEAACAVADQLFWGRHLNHLADGEFPGRCPSCKHDLYLGIGSDGFFATAQDWVRPRDATLKRTSILPAKPSDLSDVAAWLHGTATTCNQANIAFSILHVFGSSQCPSGGHAFMVAGAIAAALSRDQVADESAAPTSPACR